MQEVCGDAPPFKARAGKYAAALSHRLAGRLLIKSAVQRRRQRVDVSRRHFANPGRARPIIEMHQVGKGKLCLSTLAAWEQWLTACIRS